MRERYLVDFCWGNALCYRMDGLESNPIFIAKHGTCDTYLIQTFSSFSYFFTHNQALDMDL